MPHPLDTLIWTALTTRQAAFAEGGVPARRMQADVGPFAAAVENDSAEAIAALAALVPLDGDISLLEPSPPRAPAGIDVAMRAAGVQMTAQSFSGGGAAFALEPLGEADAAEMLALATLTRPGPFRCRTHELGRFVGVRESGRLVAMAGERLKIDGFVEVSGVCTHPDHRGRGLGAALIRAVGQRILDEGETPFLHSYADNAPAIALYRKLGFSRRCDVVHEVWTRSG